MANNFTADSNCKALWRFENGALTTDSKGTNTLTNNNTVVADTVNFKEGAASADFESGSSQYMSILDSALDAGFPLKNGDTNKIISVCAWFRLESVPPLNEYRILYSKYDSTNLKRSFMLGSMTDGTNTHIRLLLGYNSGASLEVIQHTYGLSTATWYHVTATYDNADKSYTVRIKDTSGNTLGTDKTGIATLDVNKLNVEDAPVMIGAFNPTPQYFHDGLIDELVVFDDVITAAEATQIAQGTYGTTNLIPKFMYHYQHHIGSGV